jgi:hypothetical protein
MPEQQDMSHAEREAARRKAIEDICRKTGHTPQTITITDLVGKRDVEAFIKIVLDAQEQMKRNPPTDFLIRAA